jgi:hypothetical protein
MSAPVDTPVDVAHLRYALAAVASTAVHRLVVAVNAVAVFGTAAPDRVVTANAPGDR